MSASIHETSLLLQVADSVGCPPLPPAEREQVLVFCQLFLRWNGRINLGRVDTVSEMIERHIVDSLAASRFLVAGDVIIDVGSGGGLPAIPMAIVCPGISLELYEPRAKRVAFLRTAIRELGLKSRVSVHGSRIELSTGTAPAPVGSHFSVAMSRATWAPLDWLGLGRRLVAEAKGGRVMVFTTPDGAQPLPVPHASVDYPPNRRLSVFLGSDAAVGSAPTQ